MEKNGYKETNMAGHRKDAFHVASGTVFQQYKRNAKSRGILFELTKEQLKELIKQDCYYCGNPPLNTVRSFNGRAINYQWREPVNYNGIDRVDNSMGYTLDNVVPCCYMCNWAKREMSQEQFKNWIKRIYIHLFRKLSDKTPGVILDELSTVIIKCFMAQEKLMSAEEGSEEALRFSKEAQVLNARRNKLIQSVDALLDFTDDSPTDKTYG